jgi:SAM-dependent methyltransferase
MSDTNSPDHDRSLTDPRKLWDAAAATFDEEPDHGLRDPAVRGAWTALLKTALPPTPSRVLDMGCGTGSLSVVLAELGYTVTGVDFSPAMIAQAEAKANAAQQAIVFHVMDAAHPLFSPGEFGVIVCRHLLWTLPEPDQALRRWIDLLTSGGTLLLVEGFWSTGTGIRADELIALLPDSVSAAQVRQLDDQAGLWGKTAIDERYMIRVNRKT